jgi:hypothetical protein
MLVTVNVLLAVAIVRVKMIYLVVKIVCRTVLS